MTILFAGNEPADFTGVLGHNTLTTYRDQDYARTAIDGDWPEEYAFGALAAPTPATFWLHGQLHANSAESTTGGTNNAFLDFRLGGTAYLELRFNTSELLEVRTLIGGTMTTQGTPANGGLVQNRKSIDIEVYVHPSDGYVRFYQLETLLNEWTGINTQGDNPTVTFDSFMLAGAFANWYWSEVIVADLDTRGMKLKTLEVTGAGTETGWTGVYTDVNAVDSTDVTVMSADAADAVQTFALADLPEAFSGHVHAVVTQARGVADGSPGSIQHVLRSGGVNYTGATKALDAIGPTMQVWATDPATGAAWIEGAVNALEAGVKSIA
jgi:hypothetical protein